MATRNRETLSKAFSEGQRPSAEDFQNLIDSSVNILDDGFQKDSLSGIKLAPISEQNKTVMTFVQNMTEEGVTWKVNVSKDGLEYRRFTSDRSVNEQSVSDKEPAKPPLILLTTGGDIELGESGKNIRINGTLHTENRTGKASKVVPADGKWHDISTDLEGIHALEVVCVMGKKDTGKHAVLIAHATHCFGAKPRIKKLRSHYGSFGNKLLLRWVTSKKKQHACVLQARTRLKPGEEIFIYGSITSLWDNSLMKDLPPKKH